MVDHDRVVDDEVHRHQRVDLRRVAAQPRHARRAWPEVDHRGHAGEVLQHHALHLLSLFVWIGGMVFAHFFLRPSLAVLEPRSAWR